MEIRERQEYRDWLWNVSLACKEYDAWAELIGFFRTLHLTKEFDHAWQWGVFDDWTQNPTPERLEELVDVVRFERY